MTNIKYNISNINSYLLILFAFSVPISIAITNAIGVLIILLWLIERDFKNKFYIIKNNKFALVVIAFILIHIVGLLYSQDIKWALHILKKEAILILIPIFITIVKKEHIKYYILSFMMAMSISEILSYAIWFEIVSLDGVNPNNPTPFMSHISYNPFLAYSIYILIFFALFDKSISKSSKIVSVIFIVTMSINMFITAGRGGQVVLFVLLILMFFIYFRGSFFKSFFISVISIVLVFFIAYSSSDLFKQRVDQTVNSIERLMSFKKGEVLKSSLNLRVGFNINSFNIWMDNFLFGVGSGDFPNEYKKINETSKYKTLYDTVQPHNMYLLVAVQSGLVGLMILLYMLYLQIKTALIVHDFYRPLRIGLPIMFFVMMFSDSYLLGHFTTMLFILFSSILFSKNVV
jgi:O-antigen ligase